MNYFITQATASPYFSQSIINFSYTTSVLHAFGKLLST